MEESSLKTRKSRAAPSATIETIAQAEAPQRSPLAQLQQIAQGKEQPEEARINVRLLIAGSDADGIRHFDELLPSSVVRAILDPEIANFFIPIQGQGRLKPPRTKAHWLHTSYIREVLLFDELSEE